MEEFDTSSILPPEPIASGEAEGKPLGKYDTPLSDPAEEQVFQYWKEQFAPKDPGNDYDLRGAFKNGITPDPQTGNWPDTFKKPNHPTFSDQSIYTKDRPDLAGKWEGDKYIPPQLFDTSSIKSDDDSAKDLARQHLSAYRAGQLDLTPEQVVQANLVAQDGKPALVRMAEKVAAIPSEIGKAAPKIGSEIMGAGNKEAERQNKMSLWEHLNEALNPVKEIQDVIAPAISGTLKSIPATVETVSDAARVLNPMTTMTDLVAPQIGQQQSAMENAAGDVAAHYTNKAGDAIKNAVGTPGNLQTQAVEQVAPLVAGALVPGGAGLEKGVASLSENIVRGTEKASALGEKAVAQTAVAASPSIAKIPATALKVGAGVVLGHAGGPVGELAGAVLGFLSGGIGTKARALRALASAKYADVVQASDAILQSGGKSAYQAVQDAVEDQVGKLNERVADLSNTLKQDNPKLFEKMSKTHGDGTPMHPNLTGEAKEIRDAQAQANDLQAKFDAMQKRRDANVFFDDLQKWTVGKGINTAIGAGIGAGFSGATSPPGDTSTMGEGTLLGVALGAAAPGTTTGMQELRAERGRAALQERGAFNLDRNDPEYPSHSMNMASLSPEKRDYVNTIAGAADAMGKKVVVLSPEELLSKVSPKPKVVPAEGKAVPAMPPTQGEAPNGVTMGDTLYLNRDAIPTGVAGHELSHASQQFFGKTLRESDPKLMDTFEKQYAESLAKTGSYEFKPQEERDAEVGRILLQNTPIENFYGGKTGVDMTKGLLRDLRAKLFKGAENKPTIDPVLKAPVSRADLSEMRNRMFDLGEIAAKPKSKTVMPEIVSPDAVSTTPVEQGKAPEPVPATSIPPEPQNAPTANVLASTNALEPDVIKALKKKGFSDEQIVNIDPESIVQKGVPEISPIESQPIPQTKNAARPEERQPVEPNPSRLPIPDLSSPQPTKMPEIVKTDNLADMGQQMGSGAVMSMYDMMFKKLQNGDLIEGGGPSNALRKANPEFQAGRIKSPEDLQRFFNPPETPDYSAIRKQAETARREELKGTNRKTKEAEISRAGIEAMMQEHAKAAGPNDLTFRTNRFGRTSISGKDIDWSNPAIQHLATESGLKPEDVSKLNTMSENMGKTLAIDYSHALEKEEASGASRKGEQQESTASQRVAGEAAQRKLSKSYVPTNITYNIPSKTFEVNGFSPDKFLNNAKEIIPWAKTQGLKGWESINDPSLVTDFQNGMENYKNGYTLSGKPIEGTDITSVKPNPDYTPHVLSKDKTDLLIAMMGNDSTKLGTRKASPEKLDKLELAQKNAPFYEPQTGETSKIRKMLGDESKLLESTSETLRPELIDKIRDGKVEDKQTLRPSGFKGDRSAFSEKGLPRSDFSASFQPTTENKRGTPDIAEQRGGIPNLAMMPQISDKLQKTAEQYNLRFEGPSLGGKAIAFTDMTTGSTTDYPSNISPEQLADAVLKHRALFNRKDKIGE